VHCVPVAVQESMDNSKHPVLSGTPRGVLGGELRAQRQGNQCKNKEPARVQVDRDPEDSPDSNVGARCHGLAGILARAQSEIDTLA